MDLDALTSHGFTVANDVAPEPLLAAARAAIAAAIGVDPADPSRLFPDPPLVWGVVPVHHPQALWDLRQHPAIHAVFAAVRGTDRLWVSMDRAIYKAPAHPDQPDESRIHWDLDPRSLAWPSVQGMLFLTDTLDGRAPFACVPSLFAALDRYLADHPVLDLEAPLDLDGHAVIDVPVRAGDLVVWDSRLPHHGGPNRSGAPRLSVPIAMWPEGPDDERAERIGWWRDRRAPPWWRGWPGQQDPEPGPPAELGPLGRRLVGVDRWP